MDAAGLRIQHLPRRQILDRRMQLPDAHARSRTHLRLAAYGLLQGLRPAQTAARASGEIAAPAQQLRKALPGDGNPHLGGVRLGAHFDAADFIRRIHQLFAQRKTAREILQILGRRQHDDMRLTVVQQRHRDFLGHPVGGVDGAAPHPAVHRDFDTRAAGAPPR